MKRTISQQQNYSSFNKVFNKLLKQVFKKIKKTLDNLAIVEILSLSFFYSREYRATLVAPMLTNKNMDMPCTYEGRTI